MLLLAPLLLALPAYQEPAIATEAPPVTQAASKANAVSMSFAGIESLFVDKRDQGLLNFLLETVDRLPEFAATGGWDAEMPVDQIQLISRLVMAPWDLSIDHDPSATPFPVSGNLSFHAESPDELREDEQSILGFLEMIGIEIGEPEMDRDGLRPVLSTEPLGGFEARIGSQENSADGSFVLSVNQGDSGPSSFLRPDLPDSVQHAFSMHVDASSVMNLFDFSCSSGMVPPVLRGMCDLAAKLEMNFSIGHGEKASQSVLRLENFIPLMRDLQLLDEQPLAIEDLSLIPRSATDAAILQLDPRGVVVLVERIGEAMGEDDPFGEILETEEIDLRAAIEALGNTAGYYSIREELKDENDFLDLAGFRSMTFFFEVKEEAPVRELVELAKKEIAKKAEGEDMFDMTPHFRFENGFLFVSMAEESADRAAAQAKDRANSLLSRPELLEALGGGEMQLMMLQWQDTPQLATFGYDTLHGFAEMASGFMDMAAIEMQVDRIFPAREVLFEGARPKVTTVRREGDDLAAYSVGDRSMLLHLCAAVGQNSMLQTMMSLGMTPGAGEQLDVWEEGDWEEMEEETEEER